jgi:cobalt/nickel transport system ATP-binding protein
MNLNDQSPDSRKPVVEGLLELIQLHYQYAQQAKRALNGVTLSIPAGQRIALIGPNGCGKSTLLLHCNGLLRPQKGEVFLQGHKVSYDQASLINLRRHVGLIFPNPDEQLFSASVEQDICMGPVNLGWSDPEVRQRAAEAAALCEVRELFSCPPHALSSGEKTRVALAGVLAMDPTIIIADEITSALDPHMRLRVLQIFERLISQGKAVLLATHDMEIARHWADRVVVMANGQVVLEGEPEMVFSSLQKLDHPEWKPFWQPEIFQLRRGVAETGR